MEKVVTLDIGADGIAEVCLNRPARKNAWTLEMFDELARIAGDLAHQPEVRAVILSGAGGCFSAGLDLSLMQDFARDPREIVQEVLAAPPGQPNRFQRPCTGWQALRVPVIAAIEGVAFGAGFQLALAADFRIAAPEAALSAMEAKWGLVPDMGITQTLPRLMRSDQAKELIMSARVLDAAEALSLGLLTAIDPAPRAAARAMAERLVARAPETLAAVKALVDEGWSLPPGAGLALEARLQAALIGTPNQAEAVASSLAGRPPNYAAPRRGA